MTFLENSIFFAKDKTFIEQMDTNLSQVSTYIERLALYFSLSTKVLRSTLVAILSMILESVSYLAFYFSLLMY